MKRRNRFLALLLALLMLLTLGACGRPAAETAQEAPAAEAEAAPREASAMETEAPPLPADLAAEALFSSEPYIPESLEKSVIGLDDRVDVVPSQYPYSCIAYMEVEANCGCTWTGSGFMVSKNGLVTCSHVLYCDEHHAEVKHIDFYFGFRSYKDYFYKYDGACTWWWGDRSRSDFMFDYDYGYVLFPTPVGDTTGWLGTRIISDEDAKSGVYYNAGYRDGVIKSGSGKMEIYNNLVFKHYIDTEPGYSGSPVFTADYSAVAINVGHTGNEYNYARRIDGDLRERMRAAGLYSDAPNGPGSAGGIAPGRYSILSAMDSSKVLEIGGYATENGGNAQIYGNASIDFQMFDVSSSGGYYQLKNCGSSRMLDVEWGSATPGTNVQQYESNSTGAQKWSFQDAGGGYYYIKSALGDLYLEVEGSRADNNTNVHIASFTGKDNQKWKLLQVN